MDIRQRDEEGFLLVVKKKKQKTQATQECWSMGICRLEEIALIACEKENMGLWRKWKLQKCRNAEAWKCSVVGTLKISFV